MACTTSGRSGATGGASNSAISPPATNVLPAQQSTATSTSIAATACTASSSPCRTVTDVALTGGLSIVTQAMRPACRAETTDADLAMADHTLSMMTATPCPTPTHMVHSP